ncbi:TonB-dependent receptor [Novosphingobium sp. 9]|uniref:TonB-dependent receptor n=1 Tax=Novosphingobium sp. 9 TaxID=2025349 RepID=UPI0021B6AB6E|nr:TonB-dependent receptor [Novosphingobium sp. 9]
MRNRLLFALSLGTGVGMLSIPASARTETVLPFDMPAQGLGDALRDVATRAGWELFAPGDIDSLRAPALHERLSAREAIVRLLAGTHLRARFSAGAVTIRRITDAPRPGGDQPTGAQILVTGSRIHGAPPSAPVRTVTAQDIDESGQADLGEVLRSSPLNFAGGQNPGVGTSQGDDDGNVNGASSVDLLGLGPNATLTLLNGNRLSYSGINAGVDIDAIPAGAAERIEIVADGASAIYGADAVAGVVNVALRSDYQGLETEARIGGSTDGGDFQQQYSLLAGHIWARGGIMAAYTYTGNSGIAASQRDYASSMGTDASLYPSLKRHNLLLSAHQDIGSALTARIDMLYKQTRQYSVFGGTAGQSHLYGGQDSRGKNPSFTVAPRSRLILAMAGPAIC